MDTGSDGLVVSYDNAVPWTLLWPSMVEWWPQRGVGREG